MTAVYECIVLKPVSTSCNVLVCVGFDSTFLDRVNVIDQQI